MGVFWIVLILLAVLAVVVLIRALQPRHSVPGVPVPDALALLDVRLARGGEIDVETYDVLRARLVAARSGR
jgi:uncharacterized membrane protein